MSIKEVGDILEKSFSEGSPGMLTGYQVVLYIGLGFLVATFVLQNITLFNYTSKGDDSECIRLWKVLPPSLVYSVQIPMLIIIIVASGNLTPYVEDLKEVMSIQGCVPD